MKKILIGLILIIAVIIVTRWIHLDNLSETGTIAASYLNDEGFFVLYHSDDFGRYSIRRSEIAEKPFSEFLEVLNKDPEFYVDKELYHEFFYVSNHPLSDLLGLGRVHITVMMSENEVIGAFSTKNNIIYPLHGE